MPSKKAQKRAQYRKDIAASRDRDRQAGIIRVEVRIPTDRRTELLKLCDDWRRRQ